MMKPRNPFLAVILFAAACSAPPSLTPQSTPIPATSALPAPTAVSTDTIVPTAGPTPTVPRPPTPSSQPTSAIPPDVVRLPAAFSPADLPGSGELCSQAIARPPAGWVAIPTPLAVIFKRDFEDEDLPEFTAGRGIPYLGAADTDEVKSLVCILEGRAQVGTYQPETALPGSRPEPAFQLSWKVRLLSWPEGEALAGVDLSGGDPLQAIASHEVLTGGNYGAPPEKDLLSWLVDAAGDPTLFYNVWDAAPQPEGDSSQESRDVWALVRESPAGENTGRIEFWDLQNRVMQKQWVTPAFVYGLAFQPGRSSLVVLMQSNVAVIDITSGDITKTYQPLSAEPSPLLAGGTYQNLALSPDGNLVAFTSQPIFSPGGAGLDIILWSPETGQESTISSGFVRIDQIAFALAGRLLVASGCTAVASGCDRYRLRTWEVGTGVLTGEHDNSLERLFFAGSPVEGRVVVLFCLSLAEQTSIPLCGDWRQGWLDLNRGELTDELDTPMAAVTALALSPDGWVLAVGRSWPAVIELWDLNQKRVIGYLGGGGVDLDKLVFSADGTRLVALGNGFMKVWELP